MATYRIIRYFQNHDNVLIRNGCTLDDKENRDTPRQPTMLERAMDAYIHDRGSC